MAKYLYIAPGCATIEYRLLRSCYMDEYIVRITLSERGAAEQQLWPIAPRIDHVCYNIRVCTAWNPKSGKVVGSAGHQRHHPGDRTTAWAR
jgi:hypothetical protein